MQLAILPALGVLGYQHIEAETQWPHFLKRHFQVHFFKLWILIEISLEIVPNVQANNIPALFQIMAWCQPGDKPLSEPMMA